MKKFILAMLCCLTFCTPVFAATYKTPITTEGAVRFFGRGEVLSDGSRTLNWSGAGFEFEFTGTRAQVYVSQDIGTSYFNVQIDGQEPVRMEFKSGWNTIYQGATSETHTIKVSRSSAALQGLIAVQTLRTDGEPIATTPLDRKIEFIGDSYTTGYGNIAKPSDQWETAETTDAWYSYAAYASRALNAEYTLIAYAGRGIVKGYSPDSTYEMSAQFEFAEINTDWAGVGNLSTKASHDFSTYQPQLVVIWLGTNDADNGADESAFKSGYNTFLARVRQVYPDATILCCSKATSGFPQSVKAAVEQAGGAEKGFYYAPITTFAASSLSHPSKAEAQVIGNELVQIIKDIERNDKTNAFGEAAYIESVVCRYDSNKINAEVNFDYIGEEGTLLLGVYNDGGRLIKAVTTKDLDTPIEFDADQRYLDYHVKAFYWEDATGANPFANPVRAEIEQAA